MKVACEKCGSVYNIDPNRIPERGITIKCPRCLNTFQVKPDGVVPPSAAQASPPPPAPSAPIPLTPVPPEMAPTAVKPAAQEPRRQQQAPSEEALSQLPDLPDLPPEPPPPPPPPPQFARPMPPTPPPPSMPPEPVQEAFPPIPAPPAPLAEQPPPGEQQESRPPASEGLDFGMVDLGAGASPQLPDLSQAATVAYPAAAQAESIRVPDTQRSGIEEARPRGKRMKIRRRSGKVFGPFEVDAIVRMIVEHKLLGNEEASEDGVEWMALGQVPEFSNAIKHLMERSLDERPAESADAAQTPSPVQTPSVPPIGGAGVSTAAQPGEAAEPVVEKRRLTLQEMLKLPWWVYAAAALVLVLGFGTFMAIMDKGFLGYKVVMRAVMGGPSAEEMQAQEHAVAAIDADTYAGLKKASDGLRTMLKKSRDRDKTAGLLSSIMLLFQQRYGLDQQLLAELSGLIDDLDSSSAPVPEAYFARSLYYLINRPKDKADTPMNRLSDSPYLGVMARAVAALSDRNYKLATTEFQSLQKARPTSVLALRSLGDIMLAEGNLKAAEEWYTRAVGQNPAHAAAKVELAGISLENGEDRDKIVMQVKSVLSGGDVLHPKEIARAKFILGRTYTSMKMAKEAKEMLTAALAADPDNIEYLNALGRFYLENMEFDDAMGVFGKVLIKNRKEIRATVGLIQTMIEKRRIIEAGNRINDALSFAADNPELLYLKGRVEEEFERLDSAAAAYKGVVEKKKDYLEPRLALARVYKRQGKDQQAIAELDEAKTMFPDSNILRTSRGDLLIKLHKYPEAVEELKSAVDSDPYLTEARSQLGRAQIFAGDCESAVESFSVVLKQVERYPLARYRLAQAYHCLGEYDKAIAEYETALKSGRNDSRVLTQAGRAYSEKGDHVKGIELIQEALVFDRTNAEAYYHLGMAFRRKGDRDKAADAFKQAVSREPGNAQYRFMRGQALLRAGALPEAIEELSRTEEMEPKWAKVHFAKGRTYYQQKLFKAAIAEFQKAYNLEPDRVKALYKIGRSQMEMEDYKAAIKTFQELLRKFPDFHKVHYMLGRSLQQLGRKADAFAEYKKAAVLDKKNSMVHYYLGFMYKERRDFRNAAAHFKTYLDIAPNGPYARDIKDEMDFIAAGHHKMTSGDEIE